VGVKVNEAELALMEATDGLNLSRMLLCQLCGLPPDTTLRLADEGRISLPPTPQDRRARSVAVAWANRPELKSLQAVYEMTKQNVRITRADFLPSIALTGNYLVSNPSLTNGFEQRFRGTWNVGVLVNIPLFHWGEGIYKVRKSQAEVHRAELQQQDVREKISLQVHQCTYLMDEAYRRLTLAESNLTKANENLRTAQLAFQEGILPTSQVMEAQTAWLAAQVAHLDAQIEVKMADVALRKALGRL
jgi:outer membrane protein TolC